MMMAQFLGLSRRSAARGTLHLNAEDVTQLAEKWESHNHHGLKKAKMGVAKQ